MQFQEPSHQQQMPHPVKGWDGKEKKQKDKKNTNIKERDQIPLTSTCIIYKTLQDRYLIN